MPQPPDISDLRARRDAALAASQLAAGKVRTIDVALTRAARTGDTAELTRLRSQRDAAQAEADRTRAEGTAPRRRGVRGAGLAVAADA